MSKHDFEYEKSLIGRLIGYYRKQDSRILKDLLWDTGEYFNNYCISCQKCSVREKICAPKTLYRIENGIVVDNDCYYYRLSEKLNRKLILDKILFDKLDSYRKKLTDILIDFSQKKLLQLKVELEELFEENHDVIYVAERLKLYIDVIVACLSTASYTEEKIKFYNYVKDYFDERDKILILYFIYHSGVILSKDEIIKIYNEVIDCKDNRLAFTFWHIPVFKIYKPTQFLSMLEEYKIQHESQFTKNEWYIYNDLHAYVYFNISEWELCYQYLVKNVELIDSGLDYSDVKQCSLFMRLAILSYQQNKYNEAIYYFEKCYQNNKLNITNANIAIYINVLEKMNKFEKVIDIVNTYDINSFSHEYEIKIIRYYRLKYLKVLENKDRLKKMEDYICDELIDVINRNGSMLTSLFKEELMRCVEVTKNYKKIYMFEKSTM